MRTITFRIEKERLESLAGTAARRGPSLAATLDVWACVLACALVHLLCAQSLYVFGITVDPSTTGKVEVPLMVLIWAVVPCSLVGLAVGFHSRHLDLHPRRRRRRRTRVLLVGLLATVMELLLAGITLGVMGWIFLLADVMPLPAVVRCGTLFALGAPAAPFILFVQTILAAERSDRISPRLRHAHWMVLAPLVPSCAVILIVGLFSGLRQP